MVAVSNKIRRFFQILMSKPFYTKSFVKTLRGGIAFLHSLQSAKSAPSYNITYLKEQNVEKYNGSSDEKGKERISVYDTY